MKILLNKYPKGTYKGQMSDGKFMDGYLHSNLEILADNIVRDMTFLGIIYSSTLEVGTGKSVLATQIGEAWAEIMKQKHNIDVPFTTRNVVWTPKDLIERSFELPKYSCILLDEWEDQTYWSELGVTLRKFFRKCRQLNLFMLVIIPNFFQMNQSYAVDRSAFAIDVKFGRDFERGFFSFYNFSAKRKLYIMGKKEHNYYCVKSTFNGRFLDGYGVPEKEYRQAKFEDLERQDMAEEGKKLTRPGIEAEMRMKMYKRLKEKLPESTNVFIADVLGVDPRTLREYNLIEKRKENTTVSEGPRREGVYSRSPEEKEVFWDEGLTDYEKEREDDNYNESEQPVINGSRIITQEEREKLNNLNENGE